MDNLKQRVDRIRAYYRENKIMPTYDEICVLFGFGSKNAAFKLVKKMEDEGFIEKMEKGRLKPGPLFLGLPMFNSVQAGPPTTVEEEAATDHVSIDSYLVANPSSTVLINVQGDSMIDAGIHEGDKVVVDTATGARVGDIVVAIVDGAYTVKYLDKTPEGKIVLQPGNSNYKTIIPEAELQMFGKVTGVIRKM